MRRGFVSCCPQAIRWPNNRLSNSLASMEPIKNAPQTGIPGTRHVVKGRGVVQFDASGELSNVWTRYGETAPNPWLDSPLPRVTYFVGANDSQRYLGVRLCHVFETAHDGSTERAEARFVRAYDSTRAGLRWPRKPVGVPGGSFDRGHLIAAEFGAGMESINLVNMPSSVNQAHRPTTASTRGFSEIASLGERYRDDHHWSNGTFTPRGEFILPNYRRFELVLRHFARRELSAPNEVSMRVRPSTVPPKTDVLYAEIWIGEKRIPFVIDCDLT